MAEIDKFIIMEDDIPRDGGRYPEYTYTFLIGLQSFAGGIARGYVKSFHVEKLLFFRGLDQMIFIMEDIMDAVGAVSYTHLDVYKRQGFLPITAWVWT